MGGPIPLFQIDPIFVRCLPISGIDFDIDTMASSSTICFVTSSLMLKLCINEWVKLGCLTTVLRSSEVQENCKIIGITKIRL